MEREWGVPHFAAFFRYFRFGDRTFAFAAEKQPSYDPKRISGFAFGMGVERIAMMKYGVAEIGSFYAGDMRFLGQFV